MPYLERGLSTGIPKLSVVPEQFGCVKPNIRGSSRSRISDRGKGKVRDICMALLSHLYDMGSLMS